jgi:hypothetical protein
MQEPVAVVMQELAVTHPTKRKTTSKNNTKPDYQEKKRHIEQHPT